MNNFFRFYLYSHIVFFCCSLTALKVLHLSFHRGTINDFSYVSQVLGLDTTSLFIQDQPMYWFDGKTMGNGIYNITHDRAEAIWKKHEKFFQRFDAIIVSDTTPLSRIFLQNGWKKPLIIWICNRFDYCDRATLDGEFPDGEYIQLLKNATKQSHVIIMAYNAFEHFYAKQWNIDTGNLVIKPCAMIQKNKGESLIPATLDRENACFLPPYHNDMIWLQKTTEVCEKAELFAYQGMYNGPNDLMHFKAIIHFPYAWSNVAFFENMQLGIPYFVPSISFLKTLMRQGRYWFVDYQGNFELLNLSEWYDKQHMDIISYFDSWDDLKHKLLHSDFVELRKKITKFVQYHHDEMIHRWKTIFNKIRVTR